MRIAVLHFLHNTHKNTAGIVEQLSGAITKKGHDVAVIDALHESVNYRLALYEYIVVLIPGQPLFGASLPERFAEILSAGGNVTGKKCAALVTKCGFMSGKLCTRLMNAMEHEGMFVDYFEVVENAAHAEFIGKKRIG